MPNSRIPALGTLTLRMFDGKLTIKRRGLNRVVQ